MKSQMKTTSRVNKASTTTKPTSSLLKKKKSKKTLTTIKRNKHSTSTTLSKPQQTQSNAKPTAFAAATTAYITQHTSSQHHQQPQSRSITTGTKSTTASFRGAKTVQHLNQPQVIDMAQTCNIMTANKPTQKKALNLGQIEDTESPTTFPTHDITQSQGPNRTAKSHFSTFSPKQMSALNKLTRKAQIDHFVSTHKKSAKKSLFTTQQRHFRSTRPAREQKRDYYEVLGVPRDADEATIKKAYFALAKKYHPDMSKEADAQKKFAEVSVAYETIGNAEKRRQYDQFGHDAEQFEQAGYGPGPGFNPEDILREMFFGGGMGGMGGGFGGFDFDIGGGGQAQSNRPRKGTDVQVEAKITFMEAVNGVEKQISVKSLQSCDTCKGKGDKPGAKVETCRKCNGAGMQRLMKGMFQIEAMCQPCGGKGQTTPACGTCNGETLVERTERVTVRIPPGVDASTNLRLANQGDAGYKNGPRGHLWVKLNITPDPRFRREGSDVHVTVPLPLPTAVLGGIVDVPTLNGDVRLKIPPGTAQKDTQIMRNAGIKVVNRDQKGHQYVHFDIQVPKNVSPKAKQLMEQFAVETGCKDFNSTGTPAGDNKGQDGNGQGGFGSFFNRKQ